MEHNIYGVDDKEHEVEQCRCQMGTMITWGGPSPQSMNTMINMVVDLVHDQMSTMIQSSPKESPCQIYDQ